MPEKCTAKVSKKSRIQCKTELWQTQRFGKESKQVPITTFNTQNFESWLEWFLSRKSTKDYLAESYQRPAAADGEEMADLQDSPRWKKLKELGDKYNLVFGLYIDWFNPRFSSNLYICALGKQVSTGIVILYCLNLPPEVRYLPENVFIYCGSNPITK
ncbi:hypothetical protein DFH08DRAFT_694595 [Mycena albidolilacea]|uniref:Uncharacterized protein n=1 Tax=Mycena albidolilacea TaxID=1033008 RepID=A0AAD7ETY3_9AGAR|nr:hypothetical protein DFH08DRAFT_694595 [Mycena albidolilacea]